ncbi:glycosyltransferase family 2 protein [Clostridium sp. 'White wine YQ']|uniref:glycosyltransferase family 2 protein n=1 Tax=Clostridium sp. 'White wine YQ' TaxID=3027474 RepID=UPI00236603D4|nr:glycosyltransferase family 2 protein [Clostridium sp. 'White wine YQ']MDD7792751.1 glycosyltransferase family 2 protein [Clostridium sp. 'White wine YQ']
MGKILAVIVTYNVESEISKNVIRLKNIVDELLIVDNGSDIRTKKSLEALESLEGVRIKFLTRNMGIAYAINTAFKYAEENGFEWVLTLDQDSKIFDDMIENMLKTYEMISDDVRDKVAILAPKYYEEKFYDKDNLNSSEEGYSTVLTEITSGNLVKINLLKEIGYLREDFFIDYVDHEFCLRINREGYKVLKIENALMLHNLGNKSENIIGKYKLTSSNHSPIRRYYMTRNRMWTWKEYKHIYPEWVKADKIKFWRELFKIVLFEKHKLSKIRMIILGICDFRKKKFGKYE